MSYGRGSGSVTEKMQGSGPSRRAVRTAVETIRAALGGTVRGGLDVLFPRTCPGCGATISGSESTDAPACFCVPCRRLLSPSPADCCGRCGRPGACGCGHRAEGVTEARSLDGIFWCWVYRPPLRQGITALKFHRLDFLAHDLGTTAARLLGPRLPPVDRVVAVPLHWTRRWVRGYDQAELLARAVSAELGLPFLRALRRRRRTAAQSKLGEAERRRNLESAFEIRAKASVEGRRLLLVDDVTTTGATLEAAAAALKDAGAAEVAGLTVARTPQGREESVYPQPKASETLL